MSAAGEQSRQLCMWLSRIVWFNVYVFAVLTVVVSIGLKPIQDP